MNCSLCGQPVDLRTAYQRVHGWERRGHGPSRRGGSDIVLREHRQEFACERCVMRLKSGMPAEQMRL